MLSGGQYPRGMPPPEPRPPGAPGLPGPGKSGREGPSSGTRLLVAGLAGLAAGAAVTLTVGWRYGLLAAWMFAAVVFLVQVWSHIARMDPPTTAAHAVREDSGRKTTHVLVVLAAVASLGAVALLLSSGSSSGCGRLQRQRAVGVSCLDLYRRWSPAWRSERQGAPGVDHVSIRQLSDGSSDHHRRIWICPRRTRGSGVVRRRFEAAVQPVHTSTGSAASWSDWRSY